MKVLLIVSALLVMTSSCAPVRSGTYSIASPDQDISALGAKQQLVKKAASYTVSTPVFLIPLGPPPKDSEAMKEILKEHDGDFLTNVTVESKSEIIILFGSQKTTVTADVWKVMK